MATPSLGFDNRFSTTLSSGISSSDTVIPVNSVPTASEGYLVIDSDNASYEIIYYTSKGASSVTCPSAVLGRGLGGTTAVSHSSGSGVKSMVVAEHFEALQDGTALAAGSITNAKLAHNAAWTTYVPTYTNFTVGNGTLDYAIYQQIGKVVFWAWKFTFGSTTTAADPAVVSLPVTPSSRFTTNLSSPLGHGTYFDSSAGIIYPMFLVYRSTGTGAQFLISNTTGTYASAAGVSATNPVAVGAGDIMSVSGFYEAP